MRYLLGILLFTTCLLQAAPLGFWKPFERADGPIFVQDSFDRASLGTDWTIESSADVTVVSNKHMYVRGAGDLTEWVYYSPWLTSCENVKITWRQWCEKTNASSGGSYVGWRNRNAFASANSRNWTAGVYMAADADFGKAFIMRYDGVSLNTIASSTDRISGFEDTWIDCTLIRSNNVLTFSATNAANGTSCRISTNYWYYEGGDMPPPISSFGIHVVTGTNLFDDFTVTYDKRVPQYLAVLGKSIDEGDAATNNNARWFTLLSNDSSWPLTCISSGSNNATNYPSLLQEVRKTYPYRCWVGFGSDIIFGVSSNVWWSNMVYTITNLENSGTSTLPMDCTPLSVDYRTWRSWATNNYPAIYCGWDTMLLNTYELHNTYDSGDDVHPNTNGHYVIYTNVLKRIRY